MKKSFFGAPAQKDMSTSLPIRSQALLKVLKSRAVVVFWVGGLIGLLLGFMAPFTPFKENLRPISSTFQEPREEEKFGTPRLLSIPEIGVEARVESVGLDEEKEMDVPRDPNNVAWYMFGARPGQKGNAVLAGHLDSDTGPAVFYNLSDLEEGDEVLVSDDKGNVLKFIVVEKSVYPVEEFPLDKVFGNQGSIPRLNLITCGGRFNGSTKEYSHRVVIYSELR